MGPQFSIAHYRITTKLGEGGMGEVWRAKDTKLGRDVAIKVLPRAFAENADRMARFTREAKVLALLNHPNIASIYGVEDHALVMELVDGPTLSARIAGGALPVEEALPIAHQIVEALEHAHEKGVIHRDLKPANIKITPDGVVKLLDFGLAKAAEETSAATSGGSPTMSPTMSMAKTQAGAILGSAAYMAPEQARGKAVDKRADIWEFGVVLYEMLTGRHPFAAGGAIADTIAAVVLKEPDLAALPAGTPPHVRRLLDRCLRKDPKTRLRDIGEARVALDEPQALSAPAAPKLSFLPWALAALGVAAGVAGLSVAWMRPKVSEPATVRFALPLPEGAVESISKAAVQAVPSPDGALVAFVAASSDGATSLWIRPLGSTSARRLEKTESANYPFWSPDGQFLGFFADNTLKKIAVSGGSLQTICETPLSGGSQINGDGGTWNRDGVILFSLGGGSGILRVPATGGLATSATKLDQAAGETRHAWPQFLPDGRHYLYFSKNANSRKSAIYVQELDSNRRTQVMDNDLRAAWAPPGYLLFAREGALWAQRMDPKTFRLTGRPAQVTEGVSLNESNGRAAFAVSDSGVLVYRGVAHRNAQIVWYDRSGRRLAAIGKPGPYVGLRLSPDEKRIAVNLSSANNMDLWIMDLASGALTRETSDGRSSSVVGPWSPDSRRIAMNRMLGGILELTLSSGKTRDLSTEQFYAFDWSRDSRVIVCADESGRHLAAMAPDASRELRTVDDVSYQRFAFALAPDGNWAAYGSFESGRSEITVASFPSFREKRQLSIDGGLLPQWRNDGREIFFLSPDGMLMSVDIRLGSQIEVGVPKPLFKIVEGGPHTYLYAASGDGQRFLAAEDAQKGQPAPFMVVVNWTAELKQ
jgi:serine/threonine protein kinase